MKAWTKVVSSVFMLALLAGCATTQNGSTSRSILDENYSYTHVGEAEGMSKDELYDIAEFWIARSYRSANDVTQLQSKEQGRIIARGTWPVTVAFHQHRVRHTLQIDIRDGAYRLGFDQIVFESSTSSNRQPISQMQSHVKGGVVSQVSAHIEATISSFEEAIKNQATDDDW